MDIKVIIIGVMCIVIVALIAGIIIVNNKKEEVDKKFNDINNQAIADKLKMEKADKKFNDINNQVIADKLKIEEADKKFNVINDQVIADKLKMEKADKKFNVINNQVIADKLKMDEANKKFISGLKQIQSLPIADDSISNFYMDRKRKLIEQMFMEDKEKITKTEYNNRIKKIETDERLTKIMKETGYDINNNHRLAGKYFIDIPPLEESEAGEILLKICNKIPSCHGINIHNTNYENKNPPLAKMVFTDPANTNNLAYYVNNPESYSISKSSLTQKLLE